MSPSTLALPFAIQVAVFAGVLAYLVANYGKLDQRPHLMAFQFGIWALIAASIFWVAKLKFVETASAAIAISAVMVLGALWRKKLSRFVAKSVRQLGISFVNDEPSALATLQNDCEHVVSQIAVLLDTGEWLRCDYTTEYSEAPFGPCQIGPKGDVAMYVTTIKDPQGVVRQQSTVRHEYYGDRITYIPAERIRRMNLRYKKRS
jgi:hypothetical protein